MIVTDNENSWDRDRAQGYLQIADLVVIERKRTLTILERLFAYRFQRRAGLTMLDLGCGDGSVTEIIRSRYPENTFCLLDGSEFMLEKAKQRLGDRGVMFRKETFQEYLDRPPESEKYDFVCSANAIHHLELSEKERLYLKIFQELKAGGLFVNSDPVVPSSERSEKWQFNLWIDWMREAAEERGVALDPNIIEGVPFEYKRKPENKPSGLAEQLQLLQKTGFQDVDCFYKYSIFAVFGGTK
jgi:tRNA (cmo5U34)-methyltransferase